jgi:hypothetical protein
LGADPPDALAFAAKLTRLLSQMRWIGASRRFGRVEHEKSATWHNPNPVHPVNKAVFNFGSLANGKRCLLPFVWSRSAIFAIFCSNIPRLFDFLQLNPA